MYMKKIIITAVVILCTLISNTGNAQTKFGVVGADEVFALMPETLKADSSLNAYQQALAQNFNDLQTDLNAAIEKFYKDSASMTKSMRDIKRADLQKRLTDLSGKEQKNNNALAAEKDRLISPIREKLNKAIQDVAKENGYTHVTYKEQMIVFPVADDITDKVKKKLGIK
jgi:outer membrane protein